VSTTGQQDAKGGFTLLETLVALAVLGLLTIALVHGVRGGVALWTAQNRRIAATAELDSATRILRTILTTIPIEPAALAAPLSIEFKGKSDQIALVGELPTGLGPTRQVDMLIYLREGRILIAWTPHRHDQPAAAPTPIATELIGGVRRLEFAYWGSPIPSAPAAWQANWEGPDLPSLVRVRIRFGAGDKRQWPDMIVAPRL
jgi:general secretion pathway protein J